MHINDGEVIQLVITGVLLVAFMIPWILFLVTLQGTMNAIDPATRPVPGALVWLSLLPLVGVIWLMVYNILLASAVDKEMEKRGNPDRSIGMAIAYVALMAVMVIPLLNLLAMIPLLIIWIMHWIKMSSMRRALQG
jgi:uncharacterized membrane protein YecN with MAPEG domain